MLGVEGEGIEISLGTGLVSEALETGKEVVDPPRFFGGPLSLPLIRVVKEDPFDSEMGPRLGRGGGERRGGGIRAVGPSVCLFGPVLERFFNPSEELGVLRGSIGALALVSNEVSSLGRLGSRSGTEVDPTDEEEEDGPPD